MLWSCFLFLVFYKVRKCKSGEEQSVDNIPFTLAVKKVKRVGESELVGCCVQVGSHLVDFELISRGIWRVIQSFSKFKKCFYLILTAIFLYFLEHLVHNFTHIALKTHQYGTREVFLFYHTKLIHISALHCISLLSLFECEMLCFALRYRNVWVTPHRKCGTCAHKWESTSKSQLALQLS